MSARETVVVQTPPGGAGLRDAFLDALPALTLRLVRMRGSSLKLGPLELLRFGPPKVTRHAVVWEIEGGLLAARPGGEWRVQAAGRRVEATVTSFAPRLPRPIYALSHLQVHLLFARLFLLRLRGTEPQPGIPAPPPDRIAAATVDAALCYMLAGFLGRRKPKRLLAVAAIYHVVCWSVSGRTLGGAVTRQRVVSVDGTRVSPQQAMLRLTLLPLSWLAWRPLHDRISCTTVIEDAPEKERGGREAASSPQTKGSG